MLVLVVCGGAAVGGGFEKMPAFPLLGWGQESVSGRGADEGVLAGFLKIVGLEAAGRKVAGLRFVGGQGPQGFGCGSVGARSGCWRGLGWGQLAVGGVFVGCRLGGLLLESPREMNRDSARAYSRGRKGASAAGPAWGVVELWAEAGPSKRSRRAAVVHPGPWALARVLKHDWISCRLPLVRPREASVSGL